VRQREPYGAGSVLFLELFEQLGVLRILGVLCVVGFVRVL